MTAELERALGDLDARVPEEFGRVILAGFRGSDAHGTKLPPDHPWATDDVDTFGVAVRPLEWYLSLECYNTPGRKLGWATDGDHYDHLVYDVRKFVSLLVKGNPNVHSWLWTLPDHVHADPVGSLFLAIVYLPKGRPGLRPTRSLTHGGRIRGRRIRGAT